MAVTYEWVIVDVEVKLQQDTMIDMVTLVNWRYQGSDGINTASVYGPTLLDPANPNDYIPFDQLTTAQVVAWLEQNLGPESIAGFQNQIADDLANGTNLTTVTKTLVA